MSDRDNATIDSLLARKLTRRRALSSAGKLGAAVAATAVVAGGLGYVSGYYTAPSNSKSATVTATDTVTQTATSTSVVTTTVSSASMGTTASSSSTTTTSSSSTANYVNYPNYTVTWPLDLRVDNPISGLTGSVRAAMANSILYQTDTTIPGTRAYGVLAGLQSTYPNVDWTNFDTGSNYVPVLTALQAGQNNWDVGRQVEPYYIPLGYLEPLTDYFNAWEDKAQIPASDVETMTYQGDIYMIPDEGDSHGGWWRQDLFANAGYGTFDYGTFEYSGTTPNQMGYAELTQAIAKITSQGSANGVYGTYIPNGSTAFLGPWCTDNFLKANGALRYYGDSSTCTVCLDQSTYYNQALDTLTFFQTNIPNMTPGFQTLDVNALITEVESGDLGFLFGPDPNLDGPMSATAASSTNPNAPAGVNLRDCIQPTTGWSDGIPLNPALRPTIKNVDWFGVFRGSPNLQADWEWIRAMAGFNSQLSLVGNAAGVPERLDVAGIVAADSRVDVAQWVAALNGWTYTDVPISSGYGSILSTAYVNTFDAFYAGSGTPEDCITNFAQAAASGLQKAGIPAASSSLIT